MTEVLLTFHCAAGDRDSIATVVRALSHAPVHIRAEDVRGRDFSDAGTSEQVVGQLKRSAIEVIVDETTVADLVSAVAGAKRVLPVRWHAVRLVSRGRIE